MERFLRGLMLAAATLYLALAVGLLANQPWALAAWPFSHVETKLGVIFLASIACAVAIPALWIAATQEYRAIASGAIDFAVMLAGMTVFLFQQSAHDTRPAVVIAAWASAVGVVVFGWLFAFTVRLPWKDHRPMPAPVRWSFAIFAALLVYFGWQLVSAVPVVFPWPLAPESSVMYGWIYWGAAVYFLGGLLRPCWANAAGQLTGFLVYDLVLIVPFIQHFGAVKPAHFASLAVYTTVLVYSAGLATYYLFINKETRLFGTSSAVRSGRSAPARS